MRLDEQFKKKRPIISFEIYPPKREEALKNIDITLGILSELRPDFISVTFGAGGTYGSSKTIELAKKIKYDYGIEPLVHVTCLGYTKAQIDALIEMLAENDIRNVLALRGDKRPADAPADDFTYATDLTRYFKKKTDFCVAGACYPEGHPESESMVSEMRHLKEKVDAGADFLVSQLYFDNDVFYDFVKYCKMADINVPVSAGIMPVINGAQIERMIHLCGANLPSRFRRIINRFDGRKNALFDAGLSYALSQVIDLLANDVDGIHLYTMNNPVVAMRIRDGIRNIIS